MAAYRACRQTLIPVPLIYAGIEIWRVARVSEPSEQVPSDPRCTNLAGANLAPRSCDLHGVGEAFDIFAREPLVNRARYYGVSRVRIATLEIVDAKKHTRPRAFVTSRVKCRARDESDNSDGDCHD